jgi:cytochrome c-type biogenesis protein CcmH
VVTKHRVVFLILFLALAASLAITAGVSAQDVPTLITDDEVNAVAHGLYCPVCENIPLDVCPTQACAQWRDLIRQKLEQGWSEEQVKDYFVNQYGDRVLATPPVQGFNWVFYVIIPVALLGAAVVLYSVLRRMVKRPATQEASPPGATPGVEPDYLRRMEEELKKRE